MSDRTCTQKKPLSELTEADIDEMARTENRMTAPQPALFDGAALAARRHTRQIHAVTCPSCQAEPRQPCRMTNWASWRCRQYHHTRAYAARRHAKGSR